MKSTAVAALLLSVLLVTALNWAALAAYFSQDDFFHLNAVFDKRLNDIPLFFLSRQEGYAFYRPLSRETYNLLMYKAFGLQPLPFHLVNLSLISIIGLLTFLLIKKILNNQTVSWFSLIIFSISSIHNTELYYLSSVQLLFATTLICASLLMYLNKKIILSCVFFILGLMSHEIAITFLPIVILVETLLLDRKIKRLIPFILLGLLYVAFTSLPTSLPTQLEYRPVVSIKSIVNGLSWYVIWSFGLPEMLVDFVGPGLNLNPNFTRWYSNYLSRILPILTFVVSSLIISSIFLFKRFNKKFLLFILLSFIISILPFLFFPKHKFVYYLAFATVWFSQALGYILSIVWKGGYLKRILAILIIFSLAFLFKLTGDLNKTTYWAAKRARAAEVLLSEIKKTYPSVGENATFYLINDPNYPFISEQWGDSSRQAFYILSGKDALQLLYADRSIKVYFENIEDIPEALDQQDILKIVAKFPY